MRLCIFKISLSLNILDYLEENNIDEIHHSWNAVLFQNSFYKNQKKQY